MNRTLKYEHKIITGIDYFEFETATTPKKAFRAKIPESYFRKDLKINDNGFATLKVNILFATIVD